MSFHIDVSSSYCGNIQCPHKIQTLQIYLYILLAVIFGLYKYICYQQMLNQHQNQGSLGKALDKQTHLCTKVAGLCG